MTTMEPRRHCVLLVDDSRDEREMDAEWLRINGYSTLQANTAADAYRLASELSPDVAVVDVALLGADNGLALTKRLKENAATSGVPVIILSGYVLPRDRERAYQVGCDLFLTKPCPPEDLVRAIAGLTMESAALLAFRFSAARRRES